MSWMKNIDVVFQRKYKLLCEHTLSTLNRYELPFTTECISLVHFGRNIRTWYCVFITLEGCSRCENDLPTRLYANVEWTPDFYHIFVLSLLIDSYEQENKTKTMKIITCEQSYIKYRIRINFNEMIMFFSQKWFYLISLDGVGRQCRLHWIFHTPWIFLNLTNSSFVEIGYKKFELNALFKLIQEKKLHVFNWNQRDYFKFNEFRTVETSRKSTLTEQSDCIVMRMNTMKICVLKISFNTHSTENIVHLKQNEHILIFFCCESSE